MGGRTPSENRMLARLGLRAVYMARVCSRDVTMLGLIRGRAERWAAYMVNEHCPGADYTLAYASNSHAVTLEYARPRTRMAARMVEFFMLVRDPSSNEYDASHV